MKISLNPDTERLIAEHVQSGRYESADDVVRQGLELLQERERVTQNASTNGSRSVTEIFAGIADGVDASDWEKVPADLSKNLDLYLSERRKNP